jgi:hypothetical protein
LRHFNFTLVIKRGGSHNDRLQYEPTVLHRVTAILRPGGRHAQPEGKRDACERATTVRYRSGCPISLKHIHDVKNDYFATWLRYANQLQKLAKPCVF